MKENRIHETPKEFTTYYYKHHLFNLLAICHKDGGHYTLKHGVDESVKEARRIILNLMKEPTT